MKITKKTSYITCVDIDKKKSVMICTDYKASFRFFGVQCDFDFSTNRQVPMTPRWAEKLCLHRNASKSLHDVQRLIPRKGVVNP